MDVIKDGMKLVKALADPMRLEAYLLLKKYGPQSVPQLLKHLDSRVSQPTIYEHLQILKDLGLLTSKKEGREVSYEISRDRLDEAMRALGNLRDLMKR